MSGLRIIVADCFPQINPELWGQTQRVIKNTMESQECDGNNLFKGGCRLQNMYRIRKVFQSHVKNFTYLKTFRFL